MQTDVPKNKVVAYFGSKKAVAEATGTTYQNIQQWGDTLTKTQANAVIASIVRKNKSVFLESEKAKELMPLEFLNLKEA